MNIETQTQVLSSRPINISAVFDGPSVVLYALCEDGSIWGVSGATWIMVQPPTAAASLPENLRRVKWFVDGCREGKRVELASGEGWFHGWGRGHTAIVEDDSGQVHQCAPSSVWFLDREPMIGEQGD